MGSAATIPPPIRNQWGRIIEAATFALCYGLVICSPCSGQDFYYRACLGRVAPVTQVGYL